MNEHIIINKDRSVVVPISEKKIGNRYDHNVNKITFDCPRYADNNEAIDMSRMHIFLNYMLPDKTPGSTILENVTVDETDPSIIHFDWIVTKNHTLVNGVLSTLICIKQTDTDGNELYHWNTDLFQQFIVGDGIECSEMIVDENPDVITQLLVKMDAVDARTSTEAMQGYVDSSVNTYLNQNPITPTDEQATTGINTYMDNHAQTEINAYMTENAQGCVNNYLTEHPVSPTEEQMKQGVAANSELLQNSVDDYLGRNPLQLDEGLTESTKAAPANKVGEIQSDIAELKGDLVNIHNVEKITFTKGGYIATNVKEVDKTAIVKDNIMSYAVVNCSKGEFFTINGTGGSTPRLWCFTDANGSVKAVSRAESNETNRIVQAPEDGYLIINSRTNKPCLRGRILDYTANEKEINTLEDVELIIKYDGWLNTSGDNVDISSIVNDKLYSYSITPCKKGDWFTITAVGANAPRAWCFTDISFKILSKENANISVYKLQIQAQADGYLIINDNSDALSFKGRIWGNEHFDFSKIPTSYSAGFAFPSTERTNFIDGLTLTANGISAFDLPSTEFRKQLSEIYSHVSTLKIVNGVGYVCFIENATELGDNPLSNNAYIKLAVIDNITNPTNVTSYNVAKINDTTSEGKTIISGVGEPNIIYKDGTLYIYMSCKLDDNHWHYVMRTFDTQTRTFENIVECSLSVDGVPYEFSGHTIYDHISDKVNKWTFISMSAQYATVNNDYYFGVCVDRSLTNGIIVKLSNTDFTNFEFWIEPTFKNDCLCQFESAVYELDGYLYNAVRQIGKTDLLLAKIKISDKTVEQDVIIPDANSRPTFFKNEGRLYLMHAQSTRRRTSIETIQPDLNRCYTVLQTTLYVPYPSVDVYNHWFYFTFTNSANVTVGGEEVQSNAVTLSRFRFGSYNANDIIGIIRRLLQMIN